MSRLTVGKCRFTFYEPKGIVKTFLAKRVAEEVAIAKQKDRDLKILMKEQERYRELVWKELRANIARHLVKYKNGKDLLDAIMAEVLKAGEGL